jgi:hypothetical protein
MKRYNLMRRCNLIVCALLLSLLFVPNAGAQQAGAQQILCSKSQQFSLGATSITQIVPAIVGQAIHICGIVLNTGAAAATYQLTVGTGTNCNANTVAVTPAWTLPANGSFVDRNIFTWFSSPQGYALCHTITGTGPMNVLVMYHQF